MLYDNESGARQQDLRIPEGCVITYNMFFDIEPPFEDPLSDDWKYFKEFLLQLILYEQSRPKVVLNMGWFPEYDPKGRFVVKVFRFSFPHKEEIIDKVEKVLRDAAEKKFDRMLALWERLKFLIIFKIKLNAFLTKQYKTIKKTINS